MWLPNPQVLVKGSAGMAVEEDEEESEEEERQEELSLLWLRTLHLAQNSPQDVKSGVTRAVSGRHGKREADKVEALLHGGKEDFDECFTGPFTC